MEMKYVGHHLLHRHSAESAREVAHWYAVIGVDSNLRHHHSHRLRLQPAQLRGPCLSGKRKDSDKWN
jgi:hypothetical protein